MLTIFKDFAELDVGLVITLILLQEFLYVSSNMGYRLTSCPLTNVLPAVSK